jgi:hypothetical protein
LSTTADIMTIRTRMVVVSQITRLPGNSRYAADKTRKLTGAAQVTRVGDFSTRVIYALAA